MDRCHCKKRHLVNFYRHDHYDSTSRRLSRSKERKETGSEKKKTEESQDLRGSSGLSIGLFDETFFTAGQTYSFRFEWRLHLLVLQFLPVHVAEEAVVPDVSLPLWSAAEPLGWMLGHQLARRRAEKE